MFGEQEHGPIPGHLLADHQCCNQGCCNNDHIRIVDYKTNRNQNTLEIFKKTRPDVELCPKGHPYSNGNTCRDLEGNRICRACRRQDYLAFRKKKSMEAMALI
jgi:hypothetical protein